MDVPMSAKEVKDKIRQLEKSGSLLSKKKVKQAYPELMQSALYYYPSWDHAVDISLNIKE
jgi:hypothetical protein